MRPERTATPRSDRRLWRPWRSKLIWGLGIALVALGGFAARASGNPAPRDTIRAFNRRWANPVILRLAGRSPFVVARLEHRGRRSGEPRATPVWAWPVGGGFLIPMPYGTDVDWAMNLRHAGEGVLQYQNVRYRIGNPRIVATVDALPELPLLLRSLLDLSGIRHVMRADVLSSFTAKAPPPV